MTLEEVIKLHHQGDFFGAQKGYQDILHENPSDFNATHLLGLTYHQLGNDQKAIELISQAILINPKYELAHLNLGSILLGKNQYLKALESFDRATALSPDDVNAHFKRSEVLIKLRRYSDALNAFDKLIELDPKNYLVFYQRSEVFLLQNKMSEVINDYQKAIELKPDFIEAYFSLANLLFENKKYDQAFIQFQKAIDISPNYDYLYGMYVQSKIRICYWKNLSEDLDFLEKNIRQEKKVALPFIALSLFDRPDLHQLASKVYVSSKSFNQEIAKPFPSKARKKKIRVAYYSSDFRNHPMSQLMMEIIRSHDRSQFEIYGFSFPPKQDEISQKIGASFDKFIDIASLNVDQIVQLSRKLEIDIAVDLNGHTEHARTQIFALKCAPIQIQYLGYPGTLSIDNIDYILADRTLIHSENQAYFSEKIIGLPHCYITTNSEQITADQSHLSREQFNLPEEGIIFCCFNNSYKIMPEIFDSWMRILQSVEGSVLWLLGDNSFAMQNLSNEAQARGVDPNRLIFAKRLKFEHHLARHCLADLFLDTLPYNAHTTAIDALWCGLPVLSVMGKSFASRVASTLLKAIDMPELICQSLPEYEARAIELARDPQKLDDLKKELTKNKHNTPLFNGSQITRNIESAYSIAYQRYQKNLEPANIWI